MATYAPAGSRGYAQTAPYMPVPLAANHHAQNQATSSQVETVPEIVQDAREDGMGNVVVRRYQRGRLLGKGGFARCFKFTNLESHKIFAGKVVDKSSLAKAKAKQKLLAEIKIHKSLQHRNIVGFASYFEDKYNVYIMLEICPNQSLMELVRRRKRLTEPEAAFYALQLLDAMRYLHHNNIIHRDLKLGNIFIGADMELRVGDFGLATQLSHKSDRKTTVCGTPNYIAPEILDNIADGHSFEVDTWAFGVILYTLLVGRPPFETTDVKATYQLIRDNLYSFPADVPMSYESRDLIRSILVTNPALRPRLDQIAAHPFFVGSRASIPTVLPVEALTQMPIFEPGSLQRGERLVREMMAKPLGGLISRRTAATSAQADPAPAPAAADYRSYAAPAPAPAPAPVDKENAAGLYGYGSVAAGAVVGKAATMSAPAPTNARTAAVASVTSARAAAAPARAAAPAEPTAPSSAQRRGLRSATKAAAAAAAPESYSDDDEEEAADSDGVAATYRPRAATRGAAAAPVASRAAAAPAASSRAFGSVITNAASNVPVAAGSKRPLEALRQAPAPVARSTRSAAASSAMLVEEGRPAASPPATAGRAPAASPAAPAHSAAAPAQGLGYTEPAAGGFLNDTYRAVYDALGPVSHAGPSDRAAMLVDGSPQAAPAPSAYARASAASSAMLLSSPNTVPLGSSPYSQALSAPWVTTWIDYTCKYGLGYMLSNGCVGVYFNDSTKIVLAPDQSRFEYFERGSTSPVHGTMSDDRPELKKKVTLLRHFRGFLLDEFAKRRAATDNGTIADVLVQSALVAAASPGAAPPRPGQSVNTVGTPGLLMPVTPAELGSMTSPAGLMQTSERPLAWVKKWVRTRRAIFFRLSNRTIQVCFFDGTALLVMPEGAQGVGSSPLAVMLDGTGGRVLVDMTAAQRAASMVSAERRAQAMTSPQSVGSPWSPRAGTLGTTHPGMSAFSESEQVVYDLAKRMRYARDVVQQLMTPQPAQQQR